MKKAVNKLIWNVTKVGVACSFVVMSAISVDAASPVTDTFTAKITIEADCDIVSAPDLDFGTHGVLAADVDDTSTLSVQCTKTTPYNIGLDDGINGVRKMKLGTSTIDYELYKDSSRSVSWGNAAAARKSATGDGDSQDHIIYGRVPSQTTPAPGTYQDTVTVTVSF